MPIDFEFQQGLFCSLTNCQAYSVGKRGQCNKINLISTKVITADPLQVFIETESSKQGLLLLEKRSRGKSPN